VWLVLLNAKNDVTGVIKVSEGGLHGAALRPSDVFRPVLVAGADGFAMLHNHPSGDPTPSAADVNMTKLIVNGAQAVGLFFVDHVVVTRDVKCFASMRVLTNVFDSLTD
jgi:DNA repair protein RadC